LGLTVPTRAQFGTNSTWRQTILTITTLLLQ